MGKILAETWEEVQQGSNLHVAKDHIKIFCISHSHVIASYIKYTDTVEDVKVIETIIGHKELNMYLVKMVAKKKKINN